MVIISGEKFFEGEKQIPKPVLNNQGGSITKDILSPEVRPERSGVLGVRVIDNLRREYESLPTRLVEDVRESAKDLEEGKILKGLLKGGFRPAADVAGTVFAPISATIGAVAERIGEQSPGLERIASGSITKVGEGLANVMGQIPGYNEFVLSHPNLEEDLERFMNLFIASKVKGKITPRETFSEVKGKISSPPPLPPIIEKITESMKYTMGRSVENSQIIRDTLRPSKILGKTQNWLSRKGRMETLETSTLRLSEAAKRGDPLALKTAERLENPLKTYDKFIQQEQSFKTDPKVDTALGLVGERIGNAYEKVITQRRTVGNKMDSELKKVGNKELDITNSFEEFERTLDQSGLRFNPNQNRLIPSRTSKVSTSDLKILEKYINELNRMGAVPTLAELDAFLSRMPKEVDVFKQKNNITKVTNGERIIKNDLNRLKGELNPAKNGDMDLVEYYKAREDYSHLSTFLDEGASFLGKKTQSGDFAKDASLAKSAVQSILNQGKKDWLIKLEDLTGYLALDEATLATQAMKDVGNFRGASLLELMTESTKIPMTKSGFLMKIAESGMEWGLEKFKGTPVEQTRKFIQEIVGEAEVPFRKPSGGASGAVNE